jgi:hypothetical protein
VGHQPAQQLLVQARLASGDVADMFQPLEVLAELGQGQPSKWVTLRPCSVLRAAYG